MTRHQVVSLHGGGGEIVGHEKIQQAIEEQVGAGWRFVTMSTGGLVWDEGFQVVVMWVYLVFDRED